VQLVLNDKGRVAVADKLGNAVDKVEGTITAQNSDSYTIAVSQVYQLGGASSKWSGESVTIGKEGTTGYQIRRFNQQRTVILAVAIVSAVTVFLVTTGLKASGSGSPPGDGPGQPGQSH
jgi:hypothetical protein